MATRTISTKLALDGEAEYKAALKNINAELTLHKTELEKVQAEYKNSANSMEALQAKQKALQGQLDALNKKHQEQSSMLEKAREAYQKYADQAAQLEEKQKQLQNSTEDTSEEEKKLAEELEKARANMEQAANSVISYQTQLNRTERGQADLNAELDQTQGYLDEASASADGCASSIDQYGRAVREAGEDTEDLGDTGSQAIDALAQAIVAAGLAEKVAEVAAALYNCVETFAEFQAQMSTVQAITGATADDMAALSEKAKYMGATTSFTATEAGQALEYMAMAGWKTGDMLDGLEGIMNLAAASGESLASTSDIVTDALTAFGLKASDSGHFADVLAAASSNANTNVAMMGETFSYAAPVAGALGYSIEDAALAIGLMANAGIKGSSSGTALRGVLTNLAKPSDTVAAYMKRLGISLTDNEGRVLSLADLMSQLRDRFSELTEAEKAEYAAGIAGKNAMSGLLAIVNASEADYEKLAAAIDDCSDASYRMSQTRLDNYAGQLTLLSSAVDGLKLAVGEQLEPVLANIAVGATDAVAGLTELLEACPALVPVLTGLAAAAGALAAAFAGFQIVQAVTPMITAFNAALAANPAGAVAIALMGVVTALTVMSAQTGDAGREAKNFAKSLKESQQAYEDLEKSMTEERSSINASIRSLESLLAVENKTAAQKEVIRRKVESLNQAIPDLNLAYDAEADSINMTADAMERMAENAGTQEEYAAQVERLNELYSEQAGLQEQLLNVEADLEEARANAQWDSFGGAVNDSAAAVGQLEAAESALNAAMAENEQQISVLMESTSALSAQQEAAAEQTGAVTSQTEIMAAQMETAIDSLDALHDAYLECYESALESIEGQIGLFEEMDGTAKTSVGSLIETLKGQVEYMETYAENINKAMEMGVDQGLVRKLSDGSEQSAQILASIVEGGKEDIEALNEQFAKVEEGKQDFATTVADMETEFQKSMEELVGDLNKAVKDMDLKNDTYTIGKNNMKGLIDGTASQKAALVAKYAEMGKAALAAYKREVRQASPSKAFAQAGSYDIQGIINGAESQKAALDAAYTDMARTALASMERNLPSTFAEPRIPSQNDQTAAILEALKGLSRTNFRPDGQGAPFSQADLAAAFREALSGMSVNMNRRKVGELLDEWQKNNDRSRGD